MEEVAPPDGGGSDRAVAEQDRPGQDTKGEAPARVIVHRPTATHGGLNDLHPLLQRLFSARGIVAAGELDHSLGQLPPPALMKSIGEAATRLRQAIHANERILVLGDYDTDGATAAVLALLAFRLLGARDVDYLVPNRFDYGYGLSPAIARVAAERSPAVVVTVDNGIASVEGVEVLRDAGVDVIITDHHLPGESLPRANAIVNPNQPGCEFPSRMLAGVGVMFYLLLSLRGLMREAGDFGDGAGPNLAQFLDLVALGTVADLVPLDRVNRILVAQGIARIQKGHCRPGIRALLEVAGRDPSHVASSDLGFVVAPRLNAAGRLDDISLGIECLLTDDPAIARRHATTLHHINLERRDIEQRMQQEALAVAAAIPSESGGAGLCLFGEDWHQGITGLVASRLKDRFLQPVIAFAPSTDGCITGSARSVSGLHLRDLLADIDAEHPGLIRKFGGHAMAAGLTLDAGSLEPFREQFLAAVARHFSQHPPSNEIVTDGPLPPEFFTMEVATMLRNAAPWGQLFPAPLFDNEFSVVSKRVVGEQHLKLVLRSRDRTVDAIAFRQLEPGQEPPDYDRVRAVFQLDVNEYRGNRSLQLIVEHIEPLPRAVAAG